MYGAAVAMLPPDQQAGLLANLPMVRAKNRLAAMQAGSGWSGYQDVFSTYYAAFGDRQLAERMQAKYLESLIEAKCNGAKSSTPKQ